MDREHPRRGHERRGRVPCRRRRCLSAPGVAGALSPVPIAPPVTSGGPAIVGGATSTVRWPVDNYPRSPGRAAAASPMLTSGRERSGAPRHTGLVTDDCAAIYPLHQSEGRTAATDIGVAKTAAPPRYIMRHRIHQATGQPEINGSPLTVIIGLSVLGTELQGLER